MRYLILLCLLTSSAFGQSIVVSGGHRSIVVSGHTSSVPEIVTPTPIVPIPESELEMLKYENDFLKSSLKALTEKPAAKIVVVPPAPVVVTPVTPLKKTVATTKVHMAWNISGDWSPSESETRNHLMNDHGQSNESLKGLSFQQLLDLHDALHNGKKSVSKSTSSTSVWSSNSSCPGGVCPSPQFRSRKSRR